MKRNVSMDEISDGKLYSANDLVKAGCGDCQGCSDCCRDMGNSIILDPWDVFHLTKGLSQSLQDLINAGKLQLNVVDGVILPNMSMATGACGFLDANGRCSVHAFRPGICRLFPLGRYYENGTFSYFLQIHECSNQNRTKVKVKQWIHVDNLNLYEEFIRLWHYFLLEVMEKIEKSTDETWIKQVDLYILQAFFMKMYDSTSEEEFYEEFKERLQVAKSAILEA